METVFSLFLRYVYHGNLLIPTGLIIVSLFGTPSNNNSNTIIYYCNMLNEELQLLCFIGIITCTRRMKN